MQFYQIRVKSGFCDILFNRPPWTKIDLTHHFRLFKHSAAAPRSLFAAIVIKYFYEFLCIISRTKISKLNFGGKVAPGGISAQKEIQKWDLRVIITRKSHFWIAQLAYKTFRLCMATLQLIFAILPNYGKIKFLQNLVQPSNIDKI